MTDLEFIAGIATVFFISGFLIGVFITALISWGTIENSTKIEISQNKKIQK